MYEAGGDSAGRFDNFEDAVRVNGRSGTVSWLLVSLSCDVFDTAQDMYIDSSRLRCRQRVG